MAACRDQLFICQFFFISPSLACFFPPAPMNYPPFFSSEAKFGPFLSLSLLSFLGAIMAQFGGQLRGHKRRKRKRKVTAVVISRDMSQQKQQQGPRAFSSPCFPLIVFSRLIKLPHNCSSAVAVFFVVFFCFRLRL